MHKLFALAFLVFSVAAHAAQLDLAVVQFPEVKTPAELESALAGLRLAEITNSNRTMTAAPYLKGGYVVFAQSLPVSERLASSTRISNNRADVLGKLSGGRISVKITLSEGVDAGLRRFSRRTYEASTPLAPGQPKVLSIRQISGKSTNVVRGQASVSDTKLCSVVIGQITK